MIVEPMNMEAAADPNFVPSISNNPYLISPVKLNERVAWVELIKL